MCKQTLSDVELNTERCISLPSVSARRVHSALFTSNHEVIEVTLEEWERGHSHRLGLFVLELHAVLETKDIQNN